MAPKKSAPKKSAGKKSAKARAPKSPSPMQRHNHVVGPNVDGMAAQARAAHEAPSQTPAAVTASEAPMNTPPTPPDSSATDEGQRS